MSDLIQQVSDDRNWFQKLIGKIPGFKGYFERQNRRSADKILRETVANRFEEIWGRLSSLQTDLISEGGLAYIDDMERAAIKLRQFIDRVRTATYGYAGFFDAVKVNEQELESIYRYDYAMLSMADEVSRAVDNVESSMGTDGLPASIRHLIRLSKECVDVFNRRAEIILGGLNEAPQGEAPASDAPIEPPTIPQP